MPHQSTKLPCVCEQCGTSFLAPRAEVKRGGGKYCGRTCFHRAQYRPVALVCAHCGVAFQRTPSTAGRFCSHRCFNLSRKIALTCEQCGTLFHVSAKRHGLARYCSLPCKYAARTQPLAARFWQHVDKSGECWLWTGALTYNGYGRFFVAEPHMVLAHRVSFWLAYGAIPDDLLVCHNCPDGDNPRCVNPAHLFLGNTATNKADEIEKGRHVHGERCHTAKLTAADVLTIRRRYATEPITLRQLATEYGLYFGTVGHIVRRESWQHV